MPTSRPDATTEVLRRLTDLADEPRFGDVCLVGGWLRDTLLGRRAYEIDLAADDAHGFALQAATVLRSRVVPLGGDHPLFRVPVDGGHIDISPRQGTLEEDLARRDFTVNAMALPLRSLATIGPVSAQALRSHVDDPHGGLNDLGAGVLRAVGDRAFVDDPLRAWRAARLTAVLGFRLDPRTHGLIAEALPRLRDASPAPERVCAELLRLFAADRAVGGVRVMETTGLLEHTFPELAEGYEVEQRPWHTYNVYRHQVVAFEHVDALLAPVPPLSEPDRGLWEGFWHGAGWSETRWGPLRAVLDEHRAAIRLATLLHDVAKPRTRTVEASGRTRFFGHPELGAEMVEERLRAWRFPGAFVERVALLVRQHMRPGQVMSPGEPPTDRALHRFHEALGDATADLGVLFLADSLGTAPDEVAARWPAYVRHVQRIIEWRPSRPEQARRLVDGHAVMRALGIPAGPALGRIMAALDEATAVGEVGTREEALQLAERLAEGLTAAD